MQRKKPLARYTGLKSKKPFWNRSKRPKGERVFNEAKLKQAMVQKKPMRKISKAKARKLRVEYLPAQKEFLARPENEFCAICLCRGIAPPNVATEVHHKFGRAGSLLSDVRGFIASCYPCRPFPHDNATLARRLGILGEASKWNVPIDRH